MLKIFATVWNTLIVHLWARPEQSWSFTRTTEITDTSVVTVKAAETGKRHYITKLRYHNSSGTASNLALASASTAKQVCRAPAAMPLSFEATFIPPLECGIGEAVNLQMVTTGTSTLVGVEGFTVKAS
jgi:hypothetical protein